MYAIVKCSGQQLKVAKGDVIVADRVHGDVGSTVKLDVLLLADGDKMTVGTPLVGGASVSAEVVEHKRGKKVIIFKMKRRQNYRRTKGHRQEQTVLKITGINAK
ncbi:MAG: 50S ribosomal protein L21 [Pseudomonadaceae bacterium]|nr:50S ribosomal protein L21 [Pseudomonadaceae bacterium]